LHDEALMIRSLLRPFVTLAAVLLLAFPALAADRAIIVLDASGSMWAQINGKARIDIARDTLKDVLAGVPDTLELGFMAYGHRSKGDCNDIEMLVDPAPGTAEAIGQAADKLSPKGKTPLSASVKMAAEELKYTEDKATVILITDGLETCNADPCALASELKKDGVDFKVDVVGLALTEDEANQVRCIADNTDGKYLQADDEDGLKDALNDVVSDVTEAPPPPPPSSEEPVSDINFKPSAVLDENGTAAPGDANVAWEFYKKNADGSQGEWVRTEYGAKYTGVIDPGDYIVNAKLDYAHVAMPVTIAAGAVAEPEFDLEAGFINLRPIHSKGQPVDGSAAVYTEFANGESTTSYGEVKSFVPAGKVKISVSIGSATLDDEITVRAGERVEKDLIVGAGHLDITASYVEGQPVQDGSIYFDVFDAKKAIDNSRKEISGAYGPGAKFDLMPGDYVVVTTLDGAKIETPFTIKAADAVTLDVPLNAGLFATTINDNDYLEVFAAKKDIAGNRVSFGGGYGPKISRTLPAGDYHVVLTLANSAGTKEADITIAAGERNEMQIP